MIDCSGQNLYNWLSKYIYPDLVESKSKVSRWDCYSPKYKHRIELKCRKKHYEQLIIEKSKFDTLTKKAEDNLDTPIYINATPNGIYRFDLQKVKPIWKIVNLKKTTNFTNGCRIPKEIALLSVKDAEIL